MTQYTVEAINRAVGGTLEGDPAVVITGVGSLTDAGPGQLTFVGAKKYIEPWAESGASAAVVNRDLDIEPGPERALVRVADADLAMAEVLRLFAPAAPVCGPGVHPAAVIDATAEIGEGAAVGANCYLGPGVVIGANTRLYPNVTVLDHSSIGSDSVIWSGTVIRERCSVGTHCIIHPNVTIGADGFGFRPSADGRGLTKIPQIGQVVIGDHVEIGAGTCVDRAKFGATTIGDGTKLDNLVQIGHNCTMGRCCVMAGQSGLAGSVTLGDGVVMGGGARVKDHVTVGAGTQIGGNAGVINDIPPGQRLLGMPAIDSKRMLRIWSTQKSLPELVREMKKR